MSKSRSAARKARAKESAQQARLIQYGALALISLLILAAIFFAFANQAPVVAQERLELDPILGNPAAPVSIVEYASYGCEACRAWHEAGVIEQILEEFPNQVNYIYRDIPIIMPVWSQEMGEVAQCAFDQGEDAFWAMHDALFTVTIQGATSQAQAIQLGQGLGLDVPALQSCVDAKTHYSTVRYDMNRPEARGLRSAPTWFINGQQIFNASPDILRQFIRSELSRLGF